MGWFADISTGANFQGLSTARHETGQGAIAIAGFANLSGSPETVPEFELAQSATSAVLFRAAATRSRKIQRVKFHKAQIEPNFCDPERSFFFLTDSQMRLTISPIIGWPYRVVYEYQQVSSTS